MSAAPLLVEYAYRVSENIPNQVNTLSFESIPNSPNEANSGSNLIADQNINNEDSIDDLILSTQSNFTNSVLTEAYEGMTDIYGRFKQEIIDFEALSMRIGNFNYEDNKRSARTF